MEIVKYGNIKVGDRIYYGGGQFEVAEVAAGDVTVAVRFTAHRGEAVVLQHHRDHEVAIERSPASAPQVTLYESNGDHVYIQLGAGPVFDLGAPGCDMAGRFVADAAAWVDGTWGPFPSFIPTTLDGLTPVAVWDPESPTGVVLLAKPEDIGFAQHNYIGQGVMDAWTEAHSDD